MRKEFALSSFLRTTLLLAWIAGILLRATSGLALEIRSISPSTAEAGALLTLTGGPFPADVEVLFGSETLRPDVREEQRLVVRVPPLAEGDYLLLLRSSTGTSPRGLLFRLIEPPPWISGLSPTRLEECADEDERQIRISGRAFQPGAQVLVNQAAVPSSSATAEQIVFSFPPLKSGMHSVQVVNPGGKSSLAHGVQVSSQPRIHSVTLGGDRVNSYELIISGRNFQFNSRLLVNGEVIRGVAGARPGAEFIQVLDCRTLRYTRFPVTREPRPLELQVVNPDGEQSAAFLVTAP